MHAMTPARLVAAAAALAGLAAGGAQQQQSAFYVTNFVSRHAVSSSLAFVLFNVSFNHLGTQYSDTYCVGTAAAANDKSIPDFNDYPCIGEETFSSWSLVKQPNGSRLFSYSAVEIGGSYLIPRSAFGHYSVATPESPRNTSYAQLTPAGGAFSFPNTG